MGRDKATLEVEGVPMAARVAAALRAAGADPVLAVGGDPTALSAMGFRVVPDEQPGQGPVAATATALGASSAPVMLVAACDLVAPEPAAFGRLVVALLDDPAAHVAVPVVGGRVQWTHAAWRTSARPALLDALAGGARSFGAATGSLAVHELGGLWHHVIADADTPADLGSVGRVPAMEVPEIDVHVLGPRLEAGAPLVDVREDDEFAEVRVPGAHHIPLGQIGARMDEVPTGETVYVVCARGGRSAKAVEQYRAAGIDAVNVAGGTLAWVDAGLPTESGPPG